MVLGDSGARGGAIGTFALKAGKPDTCGAYRKDRGTWREVTGVLLAVCLVTQGCGTAAPRRLDSASLVGLWRGEVDTSRRTGGLTTRSSSPKVLRIATMKEGDTAAAGHYGDTEPTARVYITVERTDNRIRIRFLPESGHRVELTLMNNDRLVGYLHRGSIANPMKLFRVRSATNQAE